MSTLYVSRVGLGLQEALDTCQSGDSIVIVDRYLDTEQPVVIDKDNITLEGKTISMLVGIRTIGIRVIGNQVTLKNLEVKGFDDIGIQIEGNETVVEHCYIYHNGGHGMMIKGNDSMIRNNSIYLNNDAGSSGFKILRGTGISLEGEGHKIYNNLCMFHYDYGIYSNSPLTYSTIKNNSIKCLNQHDWEYKKNYDIAILHSESSHNCIQANHLYSYTGILLAGPENLIERNQFSENKIACILLSSHNQVMHNMIIKANQIGLCIKKGKNHITKNVISKSKMYGITIEADDNVIQSNLITSNNSGIQNEGIHNVIENNSFYNNEQDIAKEVPNNKQKGVSDNE